MSTQIEKPKGNAKTEDWAEYAISLGLPKADVEDLTRDEIIAKVDAHQDAAEATTETPGETEEQSEEGPSAEDAQPAPAVVDEPAPDFTKFTNPQATKPVPEKDKAPATVTPQVSGTKHEVKGGDTKAVVIRGTFMVKDEGKRPRFAHKGDVVVLPKDQVEHGIKYGTLQKL